MKIKTIILGIVLLSVLSIHAEEWMNYAQNYTEGTEFYVTYMHANTQAGVTDLDIALFMAARQQATVTIKDSSNNATIAVINIPATTTANSYGVWQASKNSPAGFQIKDYYCTVSNETHRKALYITSTSPISLYMANSAASSSDASLVMPTNRLGKEYVLQVPTLNAEASEFSVVAVHDNTTVTITPSVAIAKSGTPLPPNVSYNVTLDKGQVYFAAASTVAADLSGTKICANHDVIVFNGSQSMRTPMGVQGHVCHQTTPIHMWGKRFALAKMSPQQKNIVKLTAHEDTAHVNIYVASQPISQTILPFQSYTYTWNANAANAMYIESDKQIICYQYMLARGDQPTYIPAGQTDDVSVAGGLPASTIITPIEQGINSVMFGTFQDSIHTITYYTNIICPTNSTSGMKIDGSTIPSSQFALVPGNSGYSYVSMQITNGAHNLTNSLGSFTAITYGISSPTTYNDWSYAYNVGMDCQHEDAYMLLDGARVNLVSKCKESYNRWTYSFEGVINEQFDSVAWYIDDRRFGSGDSLVHAFNQSDSMEHDIKMLVYHTSAVCGDPTVDTVMAKINNAMTYNIMKQTEYYCKGDTIRPFEGTPYEQEILANTLTPYKIYTTEQQFDSESGCDSIVHFNYQVLDPKDVNQTIHICQGGSFTYKDVVMTEPGSYSFDEYEHGKCHYTRTITIIVDPVYDVHVYDTICENELPYYWRHSETDIDTIRSACEDSIRRFATRMQCDSVIHLHLIVGERYTDVESISVNDVDLPYLWHGQSITKSGTYWDRLKTEYGCDSIYILQLAVLRTYFFGDTVTICENSSYTWRGRELSEPGCYYDSLLTKEQGDSIYFLLLNMDSMYYFPYTDQVCQNEPYTWRGRSLSTNEVGTYHYYDSLHAVNGCDSIYALTFIVNPKYQIEIERNICQGETYEFAGNPNMTWMNDIVGTHRDTVYKQSTHQCDSTLYLKLNVYPVYQWESVGVTCPDAPYHWVQGDLDTLIYQTNPGTQDYYIRETTSHGCDSVYHLLLTVNSVIVVPRNVTISDQDSVVWDNMVYAGTKYNKSTPDSILNSSDTPYVIDHHYTSVISGCDSIMRLTITVCPTYEEQESVTTCQYESYQIEGHSIWTWKKDIVGTHDTTYLYKTIYGYDSIRHLYLTVYPVYHFLDTAYTCCNKEYEWEGHKSYGMMSAGSHTLFDSLKTINNCDSIYERYLIVQDTIKIHRDKDICDVDTFLWDGTVFAGTKYNGSAVVDTVLSAGMYSYRRTYTSSTGCDSFMTLTLGIHSTYELFDAIETCQGESYHPNADDPALWTLHRDTAGVYDDTFLYSTMDGCDSVRHLHLIVHPEYYFRETDVICCNVEYVWQNHGKSIPMKGPGTYVYYDSLTTAIYGCDSVHELTLTVIDTIVKVDRHSMCDNEFYTWDGKIYSGDKYQGTADVVISASATTYEYVNTYTSVRTGCDSVERLLLNVHPTYFNILDDDSICQGETYHLGRKFIPCNTVGTYIYYDTLQSVHGCDSIIKIKLRVDEIYEFVTHETICDNSEFTWRGHTFSNVPVGESVVQDRYTTIHGCDSIYTLYLKSIGSYLFEDEYEMCDYDTTVWRSHTYFGLPATKYVFYDSLTTLNGCDSVYKLTLTVHPHYYIHDTLTMCDNETIQLRHHTLHYPVTGHYTIIDSLNSVYNCDSIIETCIFVYPTYLFTDEETICSDDSLLWRGKYYKSVSGIFYDSLKSIHGCDSVYKLIFNVIPAYKFETTVTICSNESYYFQGQNLRDDGDHHFMYYTENGCDSEYVLHLHVLPSYFMNSYETICSNETFNFRGRVLNQPGVYYDSLKTQSGCDSVFVLHLTVHPTYHTVDFDNDHCEGDVVMFHGQILTTSGTYYDSLKTYQGCDSVFEFRLNMKPSYLLETDTAVCDYKPMKWRGNYYTETGVYYDSLQTKSGCDSVYVLYLQVSPTDYDTIDTVICLGDTYMLGSQACMTTGTYYDTVSLARDFDCRVTVLHLETMEPTVFQTISNPDICADDSMFVIPHRLLGAYPDTYSVLFDDAAKAQGFKDIIDEPYSGIIEVPVPECIREEWYVRPDNYKIIVRTDNGVCDPEKTEYEGMMLVKYPSWVIEQRWNDVVAALNEYFNGNYKISNYEWVVNGSIVQSGTLSYIYMPQRLSFGDIVYARLTREGETYSIETCPIVIYDRTNYQTSDFHLIITGTPEPHGALQRISLHTDADGKFFISDLSGRVLFNGEAQANIPLDMYLPYPAGVYFLYYYLESGAYKTMKFILY